VTCFDQASTVQWPWHLCLRHNARYLICQGKYFSRDCPQSTTKRKFRLSIYSVTIRTIMVTFEQSRWRFQHESRVIFCILLQNPFVNFHRNWSEVNLDRTLEHGHFIKRLSFGLRLVIRGDSPALSGLWQTDLVSPWNIPVWEPILHVSTSACANPVPVSAESTDSVPSDISTTYHRSPNPSLSGVLRWGDCLLIIQNFHRWTFKYWEMSKRRLVISSDIFGYDRIPDDSDNFST
jgi:hypothetical protein